MKMVKKHNENDYHARNLTLTLNCLGKTYEYKALLLLAYLCTVNTENVILDA
jgi:hypothetical protein